MSHSQEHSRSRSRSRSRSPSLSSVSSSSSESSVRSDGSEDSFKKITNKKKSESNRDIQPQAGPEHSSSSAISNPPGLSMHSGDSNNQNNYPQVPIPQGGSGSSYTSPPESEKGLFSHHNSTNSHDFHPPPYSPSGPSSFQAPPQGRRFQTKTQDAFPPSDVVGPPPFRDLGGQPIYVGSAIFPTSVHPCKLAPDLQPFVRVPYGGAEFEHHGRYDLLPITNEMEWVPAKYGNVPKGRRPVDGGYEESGERLYHAVVVCEGVSVPGKTAPHLQSAHAAFGGSEVTVSEGYWILCWRE